jgi:hypothetical protein
MNSNQSSPSKACAAKNSEVSSGKMFIYLSITFFCLYLLNILLGMLSVRYALDVWVKYSFFGVLGECALLFGAVLFAVIFLLLNEPVESLDANDETDEGHEV